MHYLSFLSFQFFASFLCMGVLVSATGWGESDGSWKGEGIPESQDHGQWDAVGKDAWAPAPVYAHTYKWTGAPAPLGHDGNVIDTAEVAHAKSEHLAALAHAQAAAPADKWNDEWAPKAWAPEPKAWAPEPKAWAPEPKAWAPEVKAWAWAPAPAPAHDQKYTGPPAHIELTHDGKNIKDTPEVAHAKAAHLAAVAAASQKGYGYGHGSW